MDIVDLIKAKFLGKVSTMRTADGTTYGPAEDRYTHTPITFQALPDNESGEYLPPSALQKFFGGKGDIYVNPNKGDISQTIRHEATHSAMMQNLTPEQLEALRKGNPYHDAYFNSLTAANRNVNGATEPMAYGAENFPIADPTLRDKYVTQTANQLQGVNPALAAMYSGLAKLKSRQ